MNNATMLTLWTALTAANGAPTGVPDKPGTTSFQPVVPRTWNSGALFIKSTAGTTPTLATLKLWGYIEGIWYPLGPDPTGSGTASKYGLLNGGGTIAPYTGNVTRWSNIIDGLSNLEGIYLEAGAVSGASAAFTAVLRQVRS